MPKIRSIIATVALALIAALAVMATAASAAARRPFHQPGSPFAPNALIARSTADRGSVSRGLATALNLRAPLSASLTSIELGAPPSVPVGANPSGVAVNEATHTVYAVNQTDDTVSVIDAQACNAEHASGCGHPLATITLGPGGLVNGPGPVSAAVSPDGGTLYVTSPGGANAVAVIDARTCNAIHTSGCSTGPVASVATGQLPLALAEDPGNATLYVANLNDNTVSVINAARCNAQQTSGCAQLAPTVPAGAGPVAVAVDRRRHTVYVADLGANTVSVIDATQCNAERTAGCAHTPPVQAVGGAPDAIAVSQRTDTVYVANSGNGLAGPVPDGNTVSEIDAAACNGDHPQGCTAVPAPSAAVGAGQSNQPESVTVDEQTQNVYVANSSDDTLSVLDGQRCNARHSSGCAQPTPNLQMGAGPVAVAVVDSVHTVYIADGVDGAVAVIDDRACTDLHPSGCRPAPASTAPLAPDHQLTTAAVDAERHTAYVIDYGVSGAGPYVLDMIDTRHCNAGNAPGCNPQPPLASVALPSSPIDIAVDPSTDTLYVTEGNPGPAQLEVIAAASCNAMVSSCAKRATIPLGADGNVPQDLVVDRATHTVYVGGLANIAVIDARHCQAQDMSGCATQTPAKIPVPFGGFAVAPDTLYVTGLESFTTPGWVSVIDTRRCRAADTSRCATQTHPPRVTVGLFAQDAAVDLAHHTLYVPDNAGGDSAGQLSLIATRHCNGDDTTGCASQVPAAIPMRRAPFRETFDPFTSTLYVTNFENASVSLINTATCNASRVAGCPPVPPQVVVGSGPWSPALDPGTHTVYVPSYYDGTVSVIGTDHRRR